ncbi:MAG: hypothetical protein VXY28_04865 [Bacteroidota bacterium]|nr:hypothetical protein [Bacteroidota bacterium]
MKKTLLHYGLQRSGTNFLETLLKKNFRVNIPNLRKEREHPLQKHFRLYHDKTKIPEPKYYNEYTYDHFKEFEHSLDLEKKANGFIIISKDPYSWLLSYEKWANKCSWPIPNYSYMEEYKLFLSKWREFENQTHKIIFVRYIDLLEKPEEVLTQIQTKFELKKKPSFFNSKFTLSQKKVAVSEVFTNEKKDFYVKKKYLDHYSNQTLENVNKYLSKELMQFLRYEIITSKHD